MNLEIWIGDILKLREQERTKDLIDMHKAMGHSKIHLTFYLCTTVFALVNSIIRAQDFIGDVGDNEFRMHDAETQMHDADHRMRKAKKEMQDAFDDAAFNPGSVEIQQEYADAERNYRKAKQDYRRAKQDYYDAESEYNDFMSSDTERSRITIIDGDDVLGENDIVRPAPVKVPKQKRDVVVNPEIYPGGVVKSSCSIIPSLRLKTRDNRSSVVGQISVSLRSKLKGEPIVCLYILSEETENGWRTSKYQLRSAIMRPTLGTPMRQYVYDGWDNIYVSSRVKNGYGYRGDGSSIEEESILHYLPTITHFTMNETRPDNPFIDFYGKTGVALYHIEIWHSGECIGIKDGKIGTGFISVPCKDWFVPERWGNAERRMLKK